METRPTNSLATCVTLDQDETLRFCSKEGADKMQEPTQYRIVEVDDPVYRSRYVIQYAHRTFFRNRLVWKTYPSKETTIQPLRRNTKGETWTFDAAHCKIETP